MKSRLDGSCRLWLFSLAGLALSLAGCGAGGPKTYTVTGIVSFDGQPVEDGEILFIPAEKHFGPDAGKIVNGAFRFAAKAGVKRVEIRAARDVPGKRTPMGPVREDYIPAGYNSQSQLTATVDPVGKNHFEFPLLSKKK